MRWSALSGIAFVACFAASAAAYGSGAGSSAEAIRAYYASSGDRAHQLAGFALLTLGVLCFVVFVGCIRATLVGDGQAGTVVAVSGAVAAALLMAGNAAWAGTAFTAQLEGASRIDPEAHLLLEDTGFALVVAAAAAAIPLVAATSLAARRETRWFAWLGVLAIAGLATAYWYAPLALFLAWVVGASALAYRGMPPGQVQLRAPDADN